MLGVIFSKTVMERWEQRVGGVGGKAGDPFSALMRDELGVKDARLDEDKPAEGDADGGLTGPLLEERVEDFLSEYAPYSSVCVWPLHAR